VVRLTGRAGRSSRFLGANPVLPVPVPVPVPVPDVRRCAMPFDHERLDVYQAALDFVVLADDVIEHFPRGRSHLADQLHRAATSIVLNIAEGAGKFSKPDKRRFYVTARGSTTECAAVFDVLLRLRVVSTQIHADAKRTLERIASMLIKLAKSLEEPS